MRVALMVFVGTRKSLRMNDAEGCSFFITILLQIVFSFLFANIRSVLIT
ncbi:hypothetical protein MtrunA17_Chr4g0031111 [Medicago truncatula]|uniref:Transmembrane protein n=1 Tax=Medicago truncatula TaxID=3880 RepID=A0A396I5K8_MEDTR|nr:hypothetical protein MtrunA17_Chr4g0031111 [Medicago truncatula]